MITLAFEYFIGLSYCIQHTDATDFKPNKIVPVVGDAHGIGFLVPNSNIDRMFNHLKSGISLRRDQRAILFRRNPKKYTNFPSNVLVAFFLIADFGQPLFRYLL
jgi:hypothetical protein